MGKKRTDQELALSYLKHADRHIKAMYRTRWAGMMESSNEEQAHFSSEVNAAKKALELLVTAVKGSTAVPEG